MDTASHPRRLAPARRGVVLALVGAAAIGAGLACIIPDRDIQVRTTDINLYPVRFVEGIPLDEEARCACSPTACECPIPDRTFLPTFFDPANPAYQFCICGENKVDPRRLPGITLYVEDQDEVDGEPSDFIYAAALLDWDPSLGEPAFDYVAYRSYLDPRAELTLHFSSYEPLIIKRPRPYTRAIELDNDDAFDLCNGAGRTLEPGFHTLSIMATDRMWFTIEPMAEATADMGAAPVDSMTVTLDGVPDIAAGATYDIQTYVFQCLAEVDGDCVCDEQSP